MTNSKTILVIGTYDTKSDELAYLGARIKERGGKILTIDVSVLGDPPETVDPPDFSKHDIAAAAGSSIQEAIDSGDENAAMQIMTAGAVAKVQDLHKKGEIDGLIALGGSMGTDLALDCARALPTGTPKYIISTVSFSPLIPPERLCADIQMILWAGGLYGLSAICKSSLSQAAGAVLGAAQAVEPPNAELPVIGMTSLGLSCLSYMKRLKPALEERGFEVSVFHATGMGGMAFETLAAQGGFVCVMDFALPELGNWMFGSVVNSGSERLLNAGRAGIPQIVAPGCLDLIDFAGWQDIPPHLQDRPFHAHNRLIKSSALNGSERRETAREMGKRLTQAKAPVHVILPNRGIEEWDREGEPAHDPDALAQFCAETRQAIKPPCALAELDCHINDDAFAQKALEIFDDWVANGIVSKEARR